MSLKILLADDSLTAQNMGKKILTEAGYDVIPVSNGAQAMKKIASDQPDLVVLDVYMPGYSGVELCEHMRSSRETARTPVVLSVGKMEAFKPEEVTRVGADGLIVKPFEATELLAVVKKLAEKVPPRPKRRPEPQSAPEMMVEPKPASAEPEFQVPHQAVEIPQEIASTPVIGMDLIPEEAAESPAPVAAVPIEFDVERNPVPVNIDEGPRMSSAAGLSGVFEMEPTAHPAGEKPAEPAPVEEFERFSAPTEAPAPPQSAPEPAADAGAATVEDDFPMEASPRSDGEAENLPHAGPVETWSVPPADPGPSEYAVERFDHVQRETGVESAPPQAPQVLPELASWDEPASSLPADTPHLAATPVLDSSPAEFTAAAPVWVAEEAEIDPHEFALPLHQQMQRQAQASEPREFDPPAGPAVRAEASVPSWEPFPAAQPAAEPPTFREAAIPPEFEPPPRLPVERLESQSAYPGLAYSSPDSVAGEAHRAAEPMPAPQLEPSAAAASQPAPQISVPRVSEAPVDPARIASIVEQVLERLKPEVVAAIARELEKNGGQ